MVQTNRKPKTKKRKTQKKKYISSTFLTHDNGGRPFRVIFNKHRVDIYTLPLDFDFADDISIHDYSRFVKSYTFTKKFIGESGSAILLEIGKNKYVFIGDRVFEFKTSEPVIHFQADIGNSDVIYPVAITSSSIYFLISGGQYGYMNKDYFDESKPDWINHSYQVMWDKRNKNNRHQIEKLRTIHKRLF